MGPTQTTGVKVFNGILITVPNSTYQGDGFHISHIDRDVRTYGVVKTAPSPGVNAPRIGLEDRGSPATVLKGAFCAK